MNKRIDKILNLPTIKVKSKYIKTYDKPKTLYQRLLDNNFIDNETKEKLTIKYKTLNPFDLKVNIEKQLRIIFKYVKLSQKQRHSI